MKEIALPTTDFAENAGMTVSRVFAVLWCIAQNIYRKGEQRTMKMIENEMNVTVPLEIIKESEILYSSNGKFKYLINSKTVKV